MNPAGLVGAAILLFAPGVVECQAPPAPIRDNSFLIEEAYNQDRGVVQHVGTFAVGGSGGWALGFDQEWPLGGMRDQLSVSLALLDAGSGASFGDVELGYRRQLVGGPESNLLVAPRLSLLWLQVEDGPEGNTEGFGTQVALPVTAVLSQSFATHWNLGLTVGPFRPIVNAGASAVWLISPTVNLLVEGVWLGQSGSRPVYLLNPGARFAINAGTLQVVPGVSFPIDLTGSGETDAVLFYLSFEHPFGSSGAE